MTNLEVLRAVQHAWPQYCWPFANGNSYSLAVVPPSPPTAANMADVKFPGQKSERASSRSVNSNTSSPISSPGISLTKTDSHKAEKQTIDTSEFSKDHSVSLSTAITTSSSTPSPSSSPKSQSSHRTLTPFSTTPPHPAFSSPISLPHGVFSPAAIGGLGVLGAPALARSAGQNLIDNPMPRNCSDLMRSLAAKYNNKNNNSKLNSIPQRIPTDAAMTSRLGGLHTDIEINKLQPSKNADQQVSQKNHKVSPPPLLPTTIAPLSHSSPVTASPFSSTQALLNMVRNASSNSNKLQIENQNSENNRTTPTFSGLKRSADTSSPLDLSYSISSKRIKVDVDEEDIDVESKYEPPVTPLKSIESLLSWTVEDVCAFIQTIDLCSEYVNVFREQRIDGWCLSLLTESHLTSALNMKLGPALKLKSILSSRAKSTAPNSCQQCSQKGDTEWQRTSPQYPASYLNKHQYLNNSFDSVISSPSRPSSNHSDSGDRSPL